ncbi:MULTISPECIES: diguanylate cyclase [unclassified Thioalkalivibrio]|uniref:GGDEF domain-containing protein n=1 Tax=unclassified Thioalkalivibrio TaxID=2621013 RepID=UPI00039E1C76|nr:MULTISPECIES: diguanylate cyclase [unclassified Thioalkalivibrio]
MTGVILRGALLLFSLVPAMSVADANLHIDSLAEEAVPEDPDAAALAELDWEAQPGRTAIERDHSRWWRVRFESREDNREPRVLALREVFDARLVVYRPPDYRPETLELFDPDAPVVGSRHRLALELESASPDHPVYFRILEARSQPIGLSATSASSYLESDRQRVRFTSAVLAASVLLGLVSAIFAATLRRLAHGLLGVWVFFGGVYFAVLSGEALVLWPGPVDGGVALQAASLVASIGTLAAFSALYLFLDIRRAFPRLARVFRGLLWVVAGFLLAGLVFPGAWLAGWMNLLLLVLATITLGVAVLQARAGVGQAWFYLVGWGGVTVVVMARAGHFLMGEGTPGWLEYAHPATHVTSALVLVLAGALAARHAEREMHQARRRAVTDALTGLPNRARLNERLQELAQGAQLADRPLSVLFVDLDHFKALNDTHGHAFGDRCLQEAARTLQRHLRQHDLVARYGGEEFVVVLEENLGDASRVAETLREAVSKDCRRVDGHEIHLTVSIGLAHRGYGESLEHLLERADDALYRAKGGGRNRVVRAPDPVDFESTGRDVHDETVY